MVVEGVVADPYTVGISVREDAEHLQLRDCRIVCSSRHGAAHARKLEIPNCIIICDSPSFTAGFKAFREPR